MLSKLGALMGFFCAVLAQACAAAEPAPAVPSDPRGPVSVIAQPVLGKDGKIAPAWEKSHQAFVARAKAGNIGLLFLGDSITAGWGAAPELWNKEFAAWNPANFGIGGDRTQNLLWRITNGELDGIHPRVVVILIGTNNIGDEFEIAAAGVTEVVKMVRLTLPTSKILLLGVFPRGKSWEDGGRRITRNINRLIAKLDDGAHIFYLDLTSHFVQPDNTLLKSQFPDLLHPSPEGYQVWADQMRPLLTRLMSEDTGK